jgi:cell wall-associated NlpC family hydrolase
MVVKSKQPARPSGPALAYGPETRSRIRTGDILLFQGRGPLSRLIRWGSKSAYSHVGMAAWWNARLVVLQAAGRGVEVLPVSLAVHEYDGQVDWYTLAADVDARLDRERLFHVAVDKLGTPYATVSLLELMWRMLLGAFRWTPDPKVEPEAIFCSQYVSYCYREAGLDLREDTEDACTSPGDLAVCGLLRLMGVLHRPEAADRAEAIAAE